MDTANDRPIDAPEADALEQEREWKDTDAKEASPDIPLDVPEADALDQARDVPLDEDEEPR